MSSDPQETGHYDDTPGGKVEKAQTAAERYEDFVRRVNERADEIATMLPSTITRQKFINAAIAAIKRDPNILNASPRSFMVAVTEAAQDGLIPDGKEGVINVYKGQAKWIPMFQGIRKRARELDRLIIDAQVVYEKDKFVWHQGDEPKIEHEPAAFGGRGAMIGAYAVYRREERDGGEILHREVMDKQQIMDVKSQSKQQDGLLWGKFETEAWRKTVGRRGFKTTPVSDNLMQIVSRDDDTFAFDHAREPAKPALIPPPAPPPAPKLESKPAVTLDASVKKESVPVVQPANVQEQAGIELSDAAYAGILQDAKDELEGCETEECIEAAKAKWLDEMRVGDRKAFMDRAAERAAEIFGAR